MIERSLEASHDRIELAPMKYMNERTIILSFQVQASVFLSETLFLGAELCGLGDIVNEESIVNAG